MRRTKIISKKKGESERFRLALFFCFTLAYLLIPLINF